MAAIYGLYILVGLLWWTFFVPEASLLPALPDVLKAWGQLWKSGLFVHIGATLNLMGWAILISLVVSTIFAYSTPIPILRPLGILLTKFRFNPIQGFTLFLTVATGGGRTLQIVLLVIFTSFYFINSLVHVVKDIPDEDIIRRKTQKMNDWQILWKVAIKDRPDYLIEVVRQNISMMLMMIVSVEAMDVSQGGIGALIIFTTRALAFPKIFALQFTILFMGIGIDYLLRAAFNAFPAQKRSR